MTRTLRRSLGLLTLVALALVACARVRPLTGGPADERPPELLATSPPDSSTFLSLTPEIRLHFDEKVSTASLRQGVRTYPHIRLDEVRLDGNSAVITFADTLPADTTFAIVLGRAVQDLPQRDNRIPREVWLLFSTGAAVRSAAVYGRVAVHGAPEKKGAVLYEPIAPDTTAADDSTRVAARAPRSRYPATATDDKGLFQLFGIPPEQAFRLIAFVDGNGNLTPDEAELQATSDTLELDVGEFERGVQFDLIDPNEPAVLTGVALNTTALDARVAVALYELPESADADPTVQTSSGPGLASDSAATDALALTLETLQSAVEDSVSPVETPTDSTAVVAPDTTTTAAIAAPATPAGTGADTKAAGDPATAEPPRPPARRGRARALADSLSAPSTARADTVRPLPLPVADRAASGWNAAYEALEPEGFVRRRWTIVYASRRGDYSMRVPAGRHRMIAFVDASADSAPGMFVPADSTRLEWEPLWVGGVLELAPGERRRARAIEIKPQP